MPWSGMPAGLLSTIAGLGGAASGYGQGQDDALRRALLQQKMQQFQQEQEIKRQAGLVFQNWNAQKPLAGGGGMPQMQSGGMSGVAGGDGGGMPPQVQQIAALGKAMGGGGQQGGFTGSPQGQYEAWLASKGQGDNNQINPAGRFGQAAFQRQQPPNPAALAALGGGQQAPQMRPPQAMGGGMMGQIPGRNTPQRQGLVDLLIRDESGGRNINQQVVGPSGGYNPSTGGITGPSSASGLGQMIDSTWRGTPTAQQTGYSRAINAPPGVQKEAINDQIDKRGLADWAPYNKKFAADAKAYLGGLDLDPTATRMAQTASNQIMNTTPMGAYGRMSMDDIVGMVNSHIPEGTAPEVRLAMVQMMMPLATAQAHQDWEDHKWTVTQQEHREEFQARREDTAAQREATAAYRQDNLDFRRDQADREKSADTTVYNDPTNNNHPYVYDKRQRKATTLDGQPYTPGGVQKVGGASQGVASPAAQNLVAEGIANYQLPPLTSWALKSPNGVATMAQVMKLNPEYDATKFTGKQSGQRAMGTRSAQLTMATDVAEEQIPLVQATSDRIDRTQYPTMNAAILALEKGTGGEDIVRFMEQINTLKYVYARALNPTGVARIEDLNRFDNIISEAWSKGQIRAALDQMRQSLAAERRGVDRAMGGNKEPATSNAPPAQQSGQQGQYNTPDDVMRAVDAGTLDEEAAKKIMIEKFGYTQE